MPTNSTITNNTPTTPQKHTNIRRVWWSIDELLRGYLPVIGEYRRQYSPIKVTYKSPILHYCVGGDVKSPANKAKKF